MKGMIKQYEGNNSGDSCGPLRIHSWLVLDQILVYFRFAFLSVVRFVVPIVCSVVNILPQFDCLDFEK